jgi:hypothetical protein
MRSIFHALVLVTLLVTSAVAQPGEPAPYPAPYPPPPTDPQPPPQPYPPPVPHGGYAPPAHQYVPLQLSSEDQKLLAQGEITDGQHVAGAAVAIFFGFGIGQAVQGRWSEAGWIFALGESASLAALIIGAIKTIDNCFERTCNNTDGELLLWGGLIGFSVFRVWEVVDAFIAPPKHNRRVRELRMRLGMPMPMYTKVTPYLSPGGGGDGGGVAGLSFRF